MQTIKFQLVKASDQLTMQLIANWYLSEWKIPVQKTVEGLQKIAGDKLQFQILMTVNDLPVATGGLYNHVGLLDKVPRLNTYKNWLALVYTLPDKRQQGYGALICNHIQNHAEKLGINKIYLFTDTAERLYKRLGWVELERIAIENRNIVIMEKALTNQN